MFALSNKEQALEGRGLLCNCENFAKVRYQLYWPGSRSSSVLLSFSFLPPVPAPNTTWSRG